MDHTVKQVHDRTCAEGGYDSSDADSSAERSGFDMKFDGISGAMMNSGSSGVINNYYNNDNSRTVNQTNNSPKSLSQLEIYRMTRNALNV